MLRCFQYKYYFYYVCLTNVIYYAIILVLFVIGNILFFTKLNDSECVPLTEGILDQQVYDPSLLWWLMGSILFIDWIMLILFVQISVFLLMLWTFWNSVVEAVASMRNEFSLKNVVK